MIETEKKSLYAAFGLHVLSEIPLPELPRIKEQGDLTADVIVERNDLTSEWHETAGHNGRFVVKENLVMFQIPNTAIFSIQAGNKIIVSPMKGSDEDKIRLYLLGSCMGALLMQRKILPLHGSAVAVNGRAYAIVGESGAGKSTLASVFINREYELLSDDVIAVTLAQDQVPYVIPAYPQQKLWQESLQQFGMESSRYRPIFQRENKFAVPVHNRFSSEVLPLAGIFELIKTENDKVSIHAIQKLQRLQTLFQHTYRNFLVSRLDLIEWHFHTTTAISNRIELYQLRRPETGFTAGPLASLILKTISRGNQR